RTTDDEPVRVRPTDRSLVTPDRSALMGRVHGRVGRALVAGRELQVEHDLGDVEMFGRAPAVERSYRVVLEVGVVLIGVGAVRQRSGEPRFDRNAEPVGRAEDGQRVRACRAWAEVDGVDEIEIECATPALQ